MIEDFNALRAALAELGRLSDQHPDSPARKTDQNGLRAVDRLSKRYEPS